MEGKSRFETLRCCFFCHLFLLTSITCSYLLSAMQHSQKVFFHFSILGYQCTIIICRICNLLLCYIIWFWMSLMRLLPSSGTLFAGGHCWGWESHCITDCSYVILSGLPQLLSRHDLQRYRWWIVSLTVSGGGYGLSRLIHIVLPT